MSETKWTKGPWKHVGHGAIRGGDVHNFVNGSTQVQVAMANINIGIDAEAQEANANLIAAAPEMYDELERLVAIIEDHEYARWGIELSTDENECFQTYKLLAKARGEQ